MNLPIRPSRLALVPALLALSTACTDTRAGAPQPDEVRTEEQAVVYGDDDRMDWYAHPDQTLRQLTADAIVAMVDTGSLQVVGDRVTVSGESLGRSYGLCPDERFRDQPTAASCSGTLIDDDLVLTAGHCVSGGCGGTRWVFGYYYEGEGDLFDITTDDVFQCERVVVQSSSGWGGGDEADYAIIQLDRPATPRHQPAAFNPETWPVSVGDSVLMVGFGSGLPAKLDDGGFVLEERRSQRTYFTATTDAFGGNSGSGVFDTDYQVVGILVGGEQDYEWSGGCTRVATLPANGGGGGESVTYAILALEELCGDDWPSERLCGITAECGDGVCSLGETHGSCPEDCEPSNGGGWTCDPSYFAARDGCDCDCGVRDPDCEDPDQELFNCRPGEVCSGAGACVDPDGPVTPGDDVPASWTCDAEVYGAGDGCDCGCGAFDPDCADPAEDVFNCPPGAWCNDEGACEDDTGPLPGVDAGDGDAGFGDVIGDDAGLGGFGGFGGSGGCTASRERPSSATLLLALFGVAALRRRASVG